MRREAFKYWDLVRLILETIRYIYIWDQHFKGKWRNGIQVHVWRNWIKQISPYWPVMKRFDAFFDVSLNKLVNKQTSCQWFQMPWSHHCNMLHILQQPSCDNQVGINHDNSWFSMVAVPLRTCMLVYTGNEAKISQIHMTNEICLLISSVGIYSLSRWLILSIKTTKYIY